MINPFSAITTYDGDNFEAYINEINLIEIFGGLLEDEEIRSNAILIAKYIVNGYSIDSPMLSTDGYEWRTKNKT